MRCLEVKEEGARLSPLPTRTQASRAGEALGTHGAASITLSPRFLTFQLPEQTPEELPNIRRVGSVYETV